MYSGFLDTVATPIIARPNHIYTHILSIYGTSSATDSGKYDAPCSFTSLLMLCGLQIPVVRKPNKELLTPDAEVMIPLTMPLRFGNHSQPHMTGVQ